MKDQAQAQGQGRELIFKSLAELQNFTLQLTLDLTGDRSLRVLDVSALPPYLTHIICAGCVNLTELRLSNQTNLKHLDCRTCPQLSHVDLRSTPLLEYLDCSWSQVCYSSMDLARVPLLRHLAVQGNRSTSPSFDLDLSHVPLLEYLDCSECMDLKRLDLACVPNLKHLDCSLCDLRLFQNNSLDKLPPGLTHLDCSCNDRIQTLDLSRVPLLEYLDCGGCDALEAPLDFSAVPGLKHLDFTDSAKLVSQKLDLSPLTKLTYLRGTRHAGGSITGELLKTMKDLQHFDGVACAGLTYSFLSDMSQLKVLWLGGNPSIKEVPLAGLPGLRTLLISQCAGLTQLDLSHRPGLTQLDVFHCPGLTQLNLGDLETLNLNTLNIGGCPNVSNVPSLVLPERLERVSIKDAPWLKTLDLGRAKGLVMLSCRDTGIEEVKFARLEKLERLCIEGAPDYKGNMLDLCDMPALTSLTCSRCPWLKWICAAPKLRSISCSGCVNLSGINLSGTARNVLGLY